MLVPERKGQKKKSTVLPHFNKGHPFQLVEVHMKDAACPSYGILDEALCKHGEYHVWVEKDLVSRRFEASQLRAIELPHAPDIAYKAFTATIGGIGKHWRWQVVIAKKCHKGECELFVSKIFDKSLFETFVTEHIRPFGFCTFDYRRHKSGWTTIVKIPNHRDITFVAAAFHRANFGAVPLKDDMASSGNLGIERYDRSEHTWWNQDQRKAGPLRDTHKWKYPFLPSEWQTLPFTWYSMAANIDVPIEDVSHVPLPLRNYVCHRMKEQDPAWASHATDETCVTSRLTELQNMQLVASSYWTYVAPFDKRSVHLSCLLQFRYMLHGWLGREMGPYKQRAKYIGHGAYCRKFKNLPQYEYDNLQMEVKNKIRKDGDKLLGTGFKGTRGKYGSDEFPKYEPVNKMKRTLEAELQIRNLPCNQFELYAQQKQ